MAADPHVISALKAKRLEIEKHLEDLAARAAEARSDLFHVVSTLWLFDASHEPDRPAPAYMRITQIFAKNELLTLCLDALRRSSASLSSRDLAQRIVERKGWEGEDTRLVGSVAYRVRCMLVRQAQRGRVAVAGKRGDRTLWRLPSNPD